MLILIYTLPLVGFLFFINLISIIESIYANKEVGWDAFWGALMFAYMIWGFVCIAVY